ncbi:hypothetical protein EV191_102367 [Tamaricihabitans halophyticus]|uniref:Uncharacterized protein n=1 Tax=Tamaricihabitans halophyticus TaxID=1262583 RepID=A0A4R2R710_9PSEU|nr:hypothetical protein EV191_102367 [Tamaricihabitans halophyticus]
MLLAQNSPLGSTALEIASLVVIISAIVVGVIALRNMRNR